MNGKLMVLDPMICIYLAAQVGYVLQQYWRTAFGCRGVHEVCIFPAGCFWVDRRIIRWTTQRKVFGKPLNSQAVIRSKLASMISRVESAQTWLENITHQMNQMSYKQQSALLAG